MRIDVFGDPRTNEVIMLKFYIEITINNTISEDLKQIKMYQQS